MPRPDSRPGRLALSARKSSNRWNSHRSRGLFRNIIPAEGVILLCSKPKFGKSWLAYDLGIACTTDRFTLGTIKPAQGNVLYLALEDSKRRLQRRMTKLLPTFAQRGPTNSFSRRNGAACTKADSKIFEHGMLTQRKRAGNQSWSWSMCSRR